ncbi:hypothetical protein [Paenibacillus allorhizoplanae]|uniref:hypothetical protein n=1 Tax=Paenibacillus allorhizoplanae TaxID=2905648 RepID=UPI001F15D3BB|nr:hypothetical protein [Paenibacillus allorhizoplanae]
MKTATATLLMTDVSGFFLDGTWTPPVPVAAAPTAPVPPPPLKHLRPRNSASLRQTRWILCS